MWRGVVCFTYDQKTFIKKGNHTSIFITLALVTGRKGLGHRTPIQILIVYVSGVHCDWPEKGKGQAFLFLIFKRVLTPPYPTHLSTARFWFVVYFFLKSLTTASNFPNIVQKDLFKIYTMTPFLFRCLPKLFHSKVCISKNFGMSTFQK